MAGIIAWGVFCDDVRYEVNNRHSVIGVLPDNISVSEGRKALRRLTLYVRVRIYQGAKPGPMSIWLVLPNGHEEKLDDVKEDLVDQTIKEIEGSKHPYSTILARFEFSPFPMPELGLYKAVLRGEGMADSICATLMARPKSEASRVQES